MMKSKILYFITIIVLISSLLVPISGKLTAKTITTANNNLGNESMSTKEFTQNVGFGNVKNELDKASSEFGDLKDYLKGYGKVAKLVESGSKSYEKGLNKTKDDDKAALKQFKRASKKFNKADDKINDLEPPGSAGTLNDLSEQALDKYKRGLKLSSRAVKADDSEKMTKAKAIMSEGLALENRLVVEGGKSIVYAGLQEGVRDEPTTMSGDKIKDIKFPDILDARVQVIKTEDSKWIVKGFFDGVNESTGKPIHFTYDAQFNAKANVSADELIWDINQTEWR